jgi:TolA-binding protein
VKHLALALTLAMSAPYQCGAEPHDRKVEDSAPQALWILAERFETEGNTAARATTLQQLAERYPSSRYAQRARMELGIPDPVKGDKEKSDDKEEKPEEGDK